MFIDMSHLMEKWETSIIVMVQSKGRYEDGRWVQGKEEPEEQKAVVVPLSSDDLRHEENGTYTRKDIKLYTRFPIDEGTEVGVNSKFYKITEQKDYSSHSNVYIHFAKRIEQGGSKGMG